MREKIALALNRSGLQLCDCKLFFDLAKVGRCFGGVAREYLLQRFAHHKSSSLSRAMNFRYFSSSL